MTTSKIFRFVQRLVVLATFCFGSSAIAQDIVPPPAPPGTANYIQWDGSAYRISFGWDNPDGSITPLGRRSGGFEPDDSGPPAIGTAGDGTGSGGDGATVTTNYLSPGTNLWLYITQISTNEVQVTLSNTIPGFPYVLEIATNLLGPWLTNQAVVATTAVTLAQPVLIDTSLEGVYFRALQAIPGTLRWEVPFITTGTGVESVPSLSPDGTTVYLTTDSNILYSIDVNTGGVNWIDSIFTPPGYSLTESLENLASPLVLDNIIYVGSYDGNLYAIYPNGGTNWYRTLGIYNSVYSTSAIGTNGLIITGTDEAQNRRNSAAVAGLVAMNPDGTTNWFFQPQDPFYGNFGDIESSPAVGPDGTIYFVSEGSRLYAVSAAGQLKWFLPVPGGDPPEDDPSDTSVAIGADALYVGSTSGFVYAVNFDGSLRWVYQFPQNQVVSGSPIVGLDETVYVGSFIVAEGDSPVLTALTNGVPAWTWTNSTLGFGFAAGAALGQDGTVYIGDESGYFYAITNGAVKWSYQLPNEIVSAPTIAPDGTILVTCFDGYLRAFWGGTPLATNAQWPEFHHDSQHTGLTSLPANPIEGCAAPFVYDATNDGTHFTFNIVGESNTQWNVYSSEDLSNWMQIGTNISLDIGIGSLDTSGTNAFEDNVAGVAQRFYQLSNSNCCSQVIGFVNLTIVPGTNLIANPLYQVDDPVLYASLLAGLASPMNSLNDLFIFSDTWGTDQDPSQIFKWNGTGFDGDIYVDVSVPTWSGGGNMTLLPGSSVIVSNGTGHSYSAKFAGLVRQQQSFQIVSQTNYLSATVPIAGTITNVTSYTPLSGDVVQLWDTNSHAFTTHTFTGTAWSGGVPYLNVGQGFVLITTHSYAWTNAWKKDVCSGP